MIEINLNINQHIRNTKQQQIENCNAQKNKRNSFSKYNDFYSIHIKSTSINNYACVENRKKQQDTNYENIKSWKWTGENVKN